MAWQFDRPETGEGVVQAFRRAENASESAGFRLRGLGPGRRLCLDQSRRAGATEMTGRELLDSRPASGLEEKPGAAIITYKKKP